MDIQTIVIWLAVGAIAGWLAGLVVKGGGFGLVGDIVVGILGAFVGGWLFGVLGVGLPGPPIVATIISATIGAIVLLLIVRVLKRA
ncbi:MAG: GlsB/YeaQ/YmgE family stress response membrane protein [Alphaproteobacteria bacterium]